MADKPQRTAKVILGSLDEQIASMGLDADSMTDEELKEAVKSYSQAYLEEFAEGQKSKVNNLERAETAKEVFREQAPRVARQIVDMAFHAENESVRAACLKFAYLQSKDDAGSPDELNDILKSLKKVGV